MAPRLFVPAAQVPAGKAHLRLTGNGHRHLVRVLRMKAGDAFTIFDGAGVEIAARLVATQDDGADVALGERRTLAAAGKTITLLQGIAKGDRMDLIIQKTTELGVGRIVPILTERTIVRLAGDAASAKQRRWQAIAQEASRQCGRADVPVIDDPKPLAEAIAGLPSAQRFVLWESGDGQPFTDSLGGVPEDERHLQLLVGPEGGLSVEEIARLADFAFLPVTLGPRILRTETAAIVAVTLAQAVQGGFGYLPT